MDLVDIARILVIFGVVILLVAGILYLMAFYDFPLGNLPGDLIIRRENFTCIIPLVSSLLISAVLTIVINLIITIIRK